MDVLKAINRITSIKSLLQLDALDFGPIEKLVYYGLHTYSIDTKEITPTIKLDSNEDVYITLNLTSSADVTLFDIEDILQIIRKHFIPEVKLTFGHTINDNEPTIYIDLFVYKN